MLKYFLPRLVCWWLTSIIIVSLTGCDKDAKKNAAILVEAIRSGIAQSRPQKIDEYKPEDYFIDPKVIELCHAIDNEDVALIDKLIAEGVDVNAKGNGNMTLLLWAYPATNPVVFENILKAGANPNVRFARTFGSWTGLDPRPTKPGDSIIHTVTLGFDLPGELGYVPELRKKLQRLIESGADLNQANDEGWTPLMYAGYYGKYDFAIMFVEAGADWDVAVPSSPNETLLYVLTAQAENPKYIRPMSFSTEHQSYLKLIEILKEKGADFSEAREDVEWLQKIVRMQHMNIGSVEYKQMVEEKEEYDQQRKERRERYEQKQQQKKQAIQE